jgi:hypothetical protein
MMQYRSVLAAVVGNGASSCCKDADKVNNDAGDDKEEKLSKSAIRRTASDVIDQTGNYKIDLTVYTRAALL